MNSPCVLYGTPLTTMDPDIYQICTNTPDHRQAACKRPRQMKAEPARDARLDFPAKRLPSDV
ncbi:MAG: hypothetical protein WBW78_08560 [Terrimicrobiaceae bacterium]